MTVLVIIGAGGFGLEVAAYAADARLAVHGFLDDIKAPGTMHGGFPVLGPTDTPPLSAMLYIVGVGMPEDRKRLADKFRAQGARFARIIHPQAYVAASAKIGEGAIVAPFAFVGPEAQVGAHALINTHAAAGHETEIGDHAALCPYASIHGKAGIGACAFIGGGAQVLHGLKIGTNAKLAAGAVAYNDIPDGVLALGNPARYKETR